tara:strand:- start:222 stop:491 length:270 start_codon:yes stop_codon:yes gene_type:complete
MSYGYSLKIVRLNEKAMRSEMTWNTDWQGLEVQGVRLGGVCIKYDVPVAEVAKRLNVSRQSVYNWFIGDSIPKAPAARKIKKLIPKLRR